MVNNIIIEELTLNNKSCLDYLEQIINFQNEYDHIILTKKNILDDLSSNNSYYVIAKSEKNNEIVGFCGINILFDHADISGIAVKKQFANQGIGTLLVNDITKKCNSINIKDIFLEVRKSNTSARMFYEHLDFKLISTRKGYYDKGLEDACIYQKQSI